MAAIATYTNSTYCDAGNYITGEADTTGSPWVYRWSAGNWPNNRSFAEVTRELERRPLTRRWFKEPPLYTCQRWKFVAQYADRVARLGCTRHSAPSKKYTHKRRMNMAVSYRQKRRDYVVKLRKK